MSKVNRSTYQKVVEENKRLVDDIKILISIDDLPKKVICISKWKKYFNDVDDFNNQMQLAAKEYIKNNPDDPVVKAIVGMGH